MSKKKAKPETMTLWLTRRSKNWARSTAKDCRYEVYIGTKPIRGARDSTEWIEPSGCDFVTSLCVELGPRYLRKAGMTLRPGGGPLECVLTVKA
jgi:hypothetical protein